MLQQELNPQSIATSILNLPNRPPLMLAQDLAAFYDTRSAAINQAVQRNPDRFPEDFCFQLTENELSDLRSQNVTSNLFSNRYLPYAFTQAGALALSGVLKTPRAAEVSVIVFRAFAQIIERQRPRTNMLEVPAEKYVDLLESKTELLLLKQRQRRRLSETEKSEILRLRKIGKNNGEIGRAIQRPTPTVESFLRRVREAKNNG